MPSWLRPIVVIALLIVALPFLWVGAAALTEFGNTWTYRYRLTLGVSVNDKEHVGANVVQVRVTEKSNMLPQTGGVYTRVAGEAVAVDLGERGVLFVLLKDIERERPFSAASGMWFASADNIVQSAFPRIKGEEGKWGLALAMRRYAQGGESRELRPDQLPLLVRFRDKADPKTVEQVDPTNLEPQFGPGTRLTRATIETVPAGWFPLNVSGLTFPRWLTGDPVTIGIRRLLPWLSQDPGSRLVAATGSARRSYVALTEHGDFIR